MMLAIKKVLLLGSITCTYMFLKIVSKQGAFGNAADIFKVKLSVQVVFHVDFCKYTVHCKPSLQENKDI